MMILGPRNLWNSNLGFTDTKISDLKTAVTLAFLHVFENFKSLKLSVFNGLSDGWVPTVRKMSENMFKWHKRCKIQDRKPKNENFAKIS